MDRELAIVVWGGGALVAICFGLMIWATVAEFQACEAAGGHMVTKSSVGVGFTSGGQMATVPTSTSFCVSKDGRILD